MERPAFTKGVHQLTKNVFAFLSPDGTWGLNNAGLVKDGNRALLIDTLFDVPHTREMLEQYKAAAKVDRFQDLVVTHANGDHWYGWELAPEARITTSAACWEEMAHTPPEMLDQLAKAAPELGELGRYFLQCFDRFNFGGIGVPETANTFTGQTRLAVGDKTVELMEMGPAHTQSDLFAWVPDDKVLFAADILFVGGTPILWAGPVENMFAALDKISELSPDIIVPGHGPLATQKDLDEARQYWEFLEKESRKRFDAGVPAAHAARELMGQPFENWTDPERAAINVDTLYRGFSGDDSGPNITELFGAMASLAQV